MLISPRERITRIKAGLATSVTSFVTLQHRLLTKQDRMESLVKDSNSSNVRRQKRHGEPLGKRWRQRRMPEAIGRRRRSKRHTHLPRSNGLAATMLTCSLLAPCYISYAHLSSRKVGQALNTLSMGMRGDPLPLPCSR